MKRLSALLIISVCLSMQLAAQERQPKAYMVSDAHLDTQWNWDIQTTIREYIPKTLRQNFYLLETYPDYIFNFEGAVKYNWMKEYYPLEYEKVRKYVQEGRWHLTGSSWDATETIVSSSESWMRNIALGQIFYRQEFGTEGTDVFLPDCFGFPYNMPTMMRHCGLIGFSTQKLGWRDNAFYEGGRKYPFNLGLWQGIDGSKVMMVHGFRYSQRYPDEDLSANAQLLKEAGDSPLDIAYRYYGTGDTGGSPDIPSVRAMEKGLEGDGPVKIISATSDRLYKDFLPFEQHPELPEIAGEMTMDVHGNGCYTSQAAMKLYNRQNEHLGDAAERAAVTAEWLGGQEYPLQHMTRTWRNVIWHQFHDDLTGTSIPRAYEFSWNDELIALSRFSDVLANSVNAIAAGMNTQVGGTPVVLYNPEVFEARTIAEVVLPDMAGSYTVSDPKGRTVPSQVVTDSRGRRSLIFAATVPPAGAAVYNVAPSSSRQAKVSADDILENSVYRLTVNADGNISSIFDKRARRELVAEGKALGLVVFDNCKTNKWPAWEIIKENIDKTPVPVKDYVSIEKVENGPVRQTIRIRKGYGPSSFVQYISLTEGPLADHIDFRNEVEWLSENALLKMNFPLAVSNEKATYDIGLGSVSRGNNTDQAFEVYSHEWTDLTDRDGSYGVTILNDCKYGWDKPDDNTVRLSLLYSPAVTDRYTYQARQDFGYHEFRFSLVGHSGGLDKSRAVQLSSQYNSPLRAFAAPRHKGFLGRQFSFVSSDNDDIVVRCLKKCETGDGYFIRVYENTGTASRKAELTFAGKIISAMEADGTEEAIGPAVYEGNSLHVELPPFGVKSFRVKLLPSDESVKTIADSRKMELPFDRRCFSPNGFRGWADFSEGYSYASELLPDEGINVDGIPFLFGEKDSENGLSCKGNTLQLPAGKYNKLYILAASAGGDKKAAFSIGGVRQTLEIPNYTGFYGQWGHDGQTKGYVKPAEIGWIGSHRHSPSGDGYYEYTYMFKYALDIPAGATHLVLPDDPDIVVFAATAVLEPERAVPAGSFFRTGNKE